MTQRETIAVLGAGGTMGLAMARNLAGAGFDVRAWNRSPEKAAPLADDGAVVCPTPAEAARGATVVLTMLSDADAVLGVMRDLEEVAVRRRDLAADEHDRPRRHAPLRRAGRTSRPGVCRRARARYEGARGAGQAHRAGLGPDALRDRTAPVFDAVGARTMWLGEAGAGSKLKIAVNAWIVSVVEGAAETLALAEGLGLDPSLVLEAVAGGPLDLPYLQMKGKAMIARDFEPSFRLALAAKDAGLVSDAAAEAGLDLPLVEAIRGRLAAGAEEHGDEDMSATFLTSSIGRGRASD